MSDRFQSWGWRVPRDGDPRVSVRMSPEGLAAIEAAAREAGVAPGALIRECAERYASSVAREVSRGDLRLRRAHAVRAVSGAVVAASSLVVRGEPSARLMAERQARLNAARAKR